MLYHGLATAPLEWLREQPYDFVDGLFVCLNEQIRMENESMENAGKR